MNFPEIPTDSGYLALVFSVISAGVAGVWKLWTRVNRRFNHHEQRLATLERDSVTQAAFDSSISKIYSKVESGFQHLNERFDQIYQLMVTTSSGKS